MIEGVQLGVASEDLWFERAGVRLHAVAAGPKQGPLLILLHGFPEFWYGWRKQIGPLSAAGYRVLALDQRGYNLSSKPPEIGDYALSELVADVISVADQLGCEQFYLCGHDWGAAVAWMVALLYPQRVRKLAIINVPHPAVMLRKLRSHPGQMMRSWYIAFFQLSWLPEEMFSADDFAMGVRSLSSSSLRGFFTEEDMGRYRAAWSRPGALTAMINWYRAFARDPIPTRDLKIRLPVRILWGERDRFLLPEMAEESLALCESGELTYFPENTHWLQHEQPDLVVKALTDFFQENTVPPQHGLS